MVDYAQQTSIAPYCRFATVTPNDGTDLPSISEGFMVGGTGDVAIQDAQANAITLKALQVGVIYPFRVKRILATGTTATNIVQLFKGV